MLNEKGVRELAYVVRIGWVKPIEGADNIELVGINGWTCIAKKGEFKQNDLAVYFEIDSKLPETEWSEFLAPKHYKVKTMKLGKFGVISQGLALPASAFGWEFLQGNLPNDDCLYNKAKKEYFYENDFLTERLEVKYSTEEDNTRKAASSVDVYKKMAQRHPKVFKKKFVRWLYKYTWGKKLLYLFFGKKKDTVAWPAWVVKTDEERIQNMPYILEDKAPWIATEKIDGTSTTFTMKRGKFGKFEFYICSRNVMFDKPDKKCFYETNVYTEMAEKYNVEEVLKDILKKHPEYQWVTLQGETYGQGIQKREYGLKEHKFVGFNFITSTDGRWNSKKAMSYFAEYGIDWVPIVSESFILPDTVEELLTIATGKSQIDGGMREGLVFRYLDGTKSFKAVSNEFLLKYHQG